MCERAEHRRTSHGQSEILRPPIRGREGARRPQAQQRDGHGDAGKPPRALAVGDAGHLRRARQDRTLAGWRPRGARGRRHGAEPRPARLRIGRRDAAGIGRARPHRPGAPRRGGRALARQGIATATRGSHGNGTVLEGDGLVQAWRSRERRPSRRRRVHAAAQAQPRRAVRRHLNGPRFREGWADRAYPAVMSLRVVALHRYPVKGLSPERLLRADLARGAYFPGDRLYAIENGPAGFDPADAQHQPKVKFLMLMRNEALARLRTRYDDDSRTLVIAEAGREAARGDLATAEGRLAIEAALPAARAARAAEAAR